MTNLEIAIQEDIAQNREEAARLYELVIKADDPPLEAFINLACLYWNSTDGGHASSKSFFRLASERMYEVLNEAEEQFGNLPEVQFWRRYFDWTVLGEPQFLDEALELVNTGDTDTPYFYIYVQANYAEEYRSHAKIVLEKASKKLTTKNRYIISFIGDTVNNPPDIENLTPKKPSCLQSIYWLFTGKYKY